MSGPIEALGIGGEVSLQTVSGEITLADSTARRVDVRTVSGAVTCDLDNPKDSRIALETTSGEITARVREDSDLDVDLSVQAGRVTSAFPQVSTSDAGGSGRSLRGILGSGSGKLSVAAVSGTIWLLSRAVDDEA